jgi:dipeptidyl aminopeptidase/acylaminoacyl peptidase
LVLANSDGSAPRVLGATDQFAWASWSPDGGQLACLSIQGLRFLEVATLNEVRRLERKGFFQQLTWSPDGRWLLGVANSYGTGWSIARLNVATGEASAINRVDCCTPDWFPDSQRVVFSWRPPEQTGNNGRGWTQLWMADAEEKARQLVYAEDGRHVYGGHVSSDGRYVLFTGNLREDGDPANAGAPMALMRLRDAPIIGGESQALRALHPNANEGPLLTLPDGWEPCWTSAEILGARAESGMRPPGRPADERLAPSREAGPVSHSSSSPPTEAAHLAAELHDQGWVVYSARTERGDWDLFLMRPEGSDRRALTDTRDFNEAGPRFSPDGKRLLYYRLPRSEAVNMTYGTRDLVIADADGRNPPSMVRSFPGPRGARIRVKSLVYARTEYELLTFALARLYGSCRGGASPSNWCGHPTVSGSWAPPMNWGSTGISGA